MIATTLAMMLLARAADPVALARRDLGNCLVTYTSDQLDKGTEPDVFVKAVKDQCTDKRDAMRAAVIKSERAFGSSAKDAEEFADEEVASVYDNYANGYADYKAGNIKPGIEK